jgi:hypothetical protein
MKTTALFIAAALFSPWTLATVGCAGLATFFFLRWMQEVAR